MKKMNRLNRPTQEKESTDMFQFFLRKMPNLPPTSEPPPALMARLEARLQAEEERQAVLRQSKYVTIQLKGRQVHIALGTCPENPLTYREMTCLALLATGYNPEQCAATLGISTPSVVTYEKRIREKLGVRNRVQGLYVAIRKQYLIIV